MDTGLFITGGMDGVVKVWDTNTLAVVLAFDFKEKVRPVIMEMEAPPRIDVNLLSWNAEILVNWARKWRRARD